MRRLALPLLLLLLPLSLLLLFLPLFSSCRGAGEEDWRQGALSLSAVWSIGEKEYAGDIALTAPDAEGGRDAVIRFSAPAALSGLEVRRTGGRFSASLGDISHTGGQEYEGAFAILSLLSPDSDARLTRDGTGACTLAAGGMRLTFHSEAVQ